MGGIFEMSKKTLIGHTAQNFMKKKTFMLLIAALFIMKAAAQQVEEVQRSLITKRTATWCPNCGTWGWTLFEGLIEDNEDKAVLMAAHYDGNLAEAAAEEITDNFGGFYQPRFFLNENDINGSSSNVSAKRAEVKAAVEAAFNESPVVNVGFAPTFADNKLTANAKVKFFQETSGEYYLGIYLLEDNVVGYQASIGNNANHKKVFRFSFTDETFGKLITGGSVAAGSEFDLPFELSIGSVQGYDYEVAGIIWKKENNKYIPVNVWSTTDIGETSATADIAGLNSFEITPNITSDQAAIKIDLQKNMPNASLDIIDVNGKTIAKIKQGAFTEGQHIFPLNKNIIGNNGLFFVRLTDGKNATTRRVIISY